MIDIVRIEVACAQHDHTASRSCCGAFSISTPFGLSFEAVERTASFTACNCTGNHQRWQFSHNSSTA